jgi:RNA polymerase sigma factor (sigma-70 family)
MLPLDEVATLSQEQSHELLAIDEALTRLEADYPHAGQVFELRFFSGMSVEETAEALGISPTTVARHWKFARAWLLRELTNAV